MERPPARAGDLLFYRETAGGIGLIPGTAGMLERSDYMFAKLSNRELIALYVALTTLASVAAWGLVQAIDLVYASPTAMVSAQINLRR